MNKLIEYFELSDISWRFSPLFPCQMFRYQHLFSILGKSSVAMH